MKLIAKVNVKHGGQKDKNGTMQPSTAAPGEAFDTDDDTAQTLIASGSAATPEDYERAERASRTAEERIAELEAEKAQLEADLATANDALAKAKK